MNNVKTTRRTFLGAVGAAAVTASPGFAAASLPKVRLAALSEWGSYL